MTEEATIKAAEAKAVHLLSYRDHSCLELRRKLIQRNFGATAVDRTIEHLIEKGYLDDVRYAARWARHLACDNLYGNARIRASLLEKGIDRNLLDNAITEARTELSEAEGLDRLLQKKGGGWSGGRSEAGTTERATNKLLQALVRKGYPMELVYERLRKSGGDTPEY